MRYKVIVQFTNGTSLEVPVEEDPTETMLDGLGNDKARVLRFKRDGRAILIPYRNIQFIEVEDPDVQ